MYIEKYFHKSPPIVKADLEEMLKNDHERTTLEFKEMIQDDYGTLLKPFAGFANSQGGLLILGVEDTTKRIVGIEDKKGDMRDNIIHKVNDRIEPDPGSIYEILEIDVGDNKKVFLIDIKPTSELYGVKVDSGSLKREIGKATTYIYYLRKNSEIKQMVPSEVSRVSISKDDYQFNLGYRKSVKDICYGMIQQVSGYVEMRQEDFEKFLTKNNASNKPRHEFMDCINKSKLKNLSRNIYDTTIENVVYLLKERKRKSPRNLTAKEESAYNRLLESLGHELSLVFEPILIDLENIQQFERVADSYRQSLIDSFEPKKELYTALSLIVYMSGELNCVKSVTIGRGEKLYQKLFSSFYSYNFKYSDLDRMITELEQAYPSTEYYNAIDLRKEYSDYPNALFKTLLKVFKPVLDLRNATTDILDLQS